MNFVDKIKMAGDIQKNVDNMTKLINSLCLTCKPTFMNMIAIMYKTKQTKIDVSQFCPDCKEKIKALQKVK